MPVISARRLKRLEAAENVARAMRTWFGTPNDDLEHLLATLRRQGSIHYAATDSATLEI